MVLVCPRSREIGLLSRENAQRDGELYAEADGAHCG